MLDRQVSATESSLPPAIDSPAYDGALEYLDVWFVDPLVRQEVLDAGAAQIAEQKDCQRLVRCMLRPAAHSPVLKVAREGV